MNKETHWESSRAWELALVKRDPYFVCYTRWCVIAFKPGHEGPVFLEFQKIYVAPKYKTASEAGRILDSG